MRLNFLQTITKIVGIVTLFAAINLTAQTTVWSEDFEEFDDVFIEGMNGDGWAIYDVDGQTPAANVAEYTEAYQRVDFAASNLGYDNESNGMVSNSWFDPIGQADKWIATPAITVDGSGLQLKYRVCSQDNSGDFFESYEVYISTTGNSLDDLMNATLVNSETDIPAEWREVSVDLADYEGQTIYVGFRNVSFDKFLFLLDDISVEEPAQFELTTGTADLGIEYAEVPLSQVQPIGGFSMNIANTGFQDQTNASLGVIVSTFDDAGLIVEIANEMGEPMDLMSGANETLTNDYSYTPDAVGQYIVEFYTLSDQQTDTLYADFGTYLVTEGEYSQAAFFLQDVVDDFQAFFIPFNDYDDNNNVVTYAAGALGAGFEIFNETTVDSISTVLGPFAEGGANGITMDVYALNDDNTVGDLLGSTVPVQPDGGENNQFVQLQMECPLTLAPGRYVAALNDPIDGAANVISCNYYFNPDNVFVLSDGVWGPINPAFGLTPYIFVQVTDEEIGAASAISIDAAPSCLSVDLTGVAADGAICDWSWDMGDGTMLMGSSVSHNYTDEGTYTVTLTGSFGGTTLTETISVEAACNLNVDVNASTGSADATVTGCTSGLSYEWTNSTGGVIGNTASIDGLSPESEYTLTVNDAGGCSTSVDFTTAACGITADIVTDESSATIPTNSISGADGNVTFTWMNSNGGVIDSPFGSIVTDLTPGDYTVTLTDEAGCSNTFEFTIPDVVNPGIEDIASVLSYDLFPNPATNVLNINLELETAENVRVEVLNAVGQVVIATAFVKTNNYIQQLDVNDLTNGVYLVRVIVGDKTAANQIVIAK